jgi:hypothetical protein
LNRGFNRLRGWYKLWLRYLFGFKSSNAHYVKGLSYRVFLSVPNIVLKVVSGVCPFCGGSFNDGSHIYYHLTKKTRCGGRLFKVFARFFECDGVDRDLVYMMFPDYVVSVYRRFARSVICSGGFDGRKVYVNLFNLERCSLRSVDVAYFVDCGDWRILKSVEGVVGDGDS